MKKLLWLVLVLAVSYANGQGQSVKLNNGELKPGMKMPDISLGTTINNHTGKTRFSEFTGKLVILDFWSTTCLSCMAGFPHMLELQKQFGDKIQIFLVNPLQTKEQMERGFALLNKNRRDHGKGDTSNFKLPADLPVIINAKELFKLFPSHGYIGYHVWIDGNGVIRLRGPGPQNTYPEKIRDLLAGKQIDFLGDFPFYDVRRPLCSVIQDATNPFIQYSSSFGTYADGLSGGAAENVIDSATKTVRNVLINQSILEMYRMAVKNKMKDDRLIWGERVILNVKDTSQFTIGRLYSGPDTDKENKKASFCYDQVVPLSLPESERQQFMLENLNRYVGALYGAKGKTEKRKMPCYILIRTSSIDKIKTKGGGSRMGPGPVMNGKQSFSCTNCPLRSCFSSSPITGLVHQFKFFTLNDIFLDETGYAGNVDMILPSADLKTLEDIRKALKVYDLDIIEGEREVDMLIISDQDSKVKNIN